ncbi:hypothetical protein EVA_05862 [gut metagenome]|uniref:Uncharacterized protein n=1 Tax=gut metagenome TaxID=749906 RepID=J9GGH7_9ZZZZ
MCQVIVGNLPTSFFPYDFFLFLGMLNKPYGFSFV